MKTLNFSGNKHFIARCLLSVPFSIFLGDSISRLALYTVRMFPCGVANPSSLPPADLYLNGYLTWSFPLFFLTKYQFGFAGSLYLV